MTETHPWLDNNGKPKYIKRIKELMKEKNLTQSQLAELSGFSAATISDWLSNTVEPKVESFFALAFALDVSIDYLAGRDRYEKPDVNDVYRLTGLSDKAIAKLRINNKKLKNNKKNNGADNKPAHSLAMLNYLIDNIDTSPLLNNLYSYLLEEHIENEVDCETDYIAQSYFVKVVKNLFSIKKKLENNIE